MVVGRGGREGWLWQWSGGGGGGGGCCSCELGPIQNCHEAVCVCVCVCVCSHSMRNERQHDQRLISNTAEELGSLSLNMSVT